MSRTLLLTLLAATLPLASTLTPGLELVYSLDLATQGISITADDRKFLSQRYSLTLPPQAVELLADNTTVLYPNAAWNSYNASNSSSDPRTTFVAIDGARLGPDARYWLADGGTAGLNGSTKLVGVNTTTDEVDKIYYLDDINAAGGNVDDVRFNKGQTVAYLSDTSGALVVLNMTSGEYIRVLVDDPSATAYYPMMYNHTLLPGYGTQATLAVGLDQMEVSPDGTYLFYQPCNGGLYKIETSLLDASLSNTTLAASLGNYTTPVAQTPSTGGSTIDAAGNIYLSDTSLLAIWKVTPEGYATMMIQDDALIWTDLMWVSADGYLWLPASQMRPGGNGLMAAGPNNIFRYYIGEGPSAIDHA